MSEWVLGRETPASISNAKTGSWFTSSINVRKTRVVLRPTPSILVTSRPIASARTLLVPNAFLRRFQLKLCDMDPAVSPKPPFCLQRRTNIHTQDYPATATPTSPRPPNETPPPLPPNPQSGTQKADKGKQKKISKAEKATAASNAVNNGVDAQLAHATKLVEDAQLTGKLPDILNATMDREIKFGEVAERYYLGDVLMRFDDLEDTEVITGLSNNRTVMTGHYKRLGIDMLMGGVRDDENPMTIVANPADFADGVLKKHAGPGEAVPVRWKNDGGSKMIGMLAGHHRLLGLRHGRELGKKQIRQLVAEKRMIEEEGEDDVEGGGEGSAGARRTVQQVEADLEVMTKKVARLSFFRVRVYSLGGYLFIVSFRFGRTNVY